MEVVLMAVCAAALAGFAGLRFVQVLPWGRAEATCLGLPNGGPMWTGREVPFTFHTAAGHAVQAGLRIYERGWEPTIGRRVRIRYDPADPTRIMSEASIWFWPVSAAACAALAVRLVLLAAGV